MPRGRKRKAVRAEAVADDEAAAAAPAVEEAAVAAAVEEEEVVAATADASTDDGPAAKKAPPPRKKRAPRTKQATVRNATTAGAPTSDEWSRELYQLLLYRADHGDTHVSPKDEKHAELSAWVQEQRRQYKVHQTNPNQSHLTEEQIRILTSLQFNWHTRGEEHWRIHFEKLQAFHAKHGHCLVPRINPEAPKLGDWVCEQRRQNKLLLRNKPSLMTLEHKQQLTQLGFVFQLRNRPEWNDRYDQLVEYKKQNGDTLVPQFYKEDKSLGKWVAKQREQYKLMKDGKHSFLTPDRLEMLDKIGFCWSIKGKVAREYYTDIAVAGQATATSAEGVVPTVATLPTMSATPLGDVPSEPDDSAPVSI